MLDNIRVILVIWFLDVSCGLPSLPTCTDAKYLYHGYTYSLDQTTRERTWSHCEFPNPKYDGVICGMLTTGEHHLVCDPDLLLSHSDKISIDEQLKVIQRNSSTVCISSNGEKQSYVVALAIVDKVRVPDLTTKESCYNGCNEIHPTLLKNNRVPTEQEISVTMENFAENLRTSWRLGVCGNDIVVLFVKQFNRTYIAVGPHAASVLDKNKVDSLASNFQKVLTGNGDLLSAIMEILQEMMNMLIGITPAHIVLTIHLLLLAGIAAFYIFFVHLRWTEYNVWGSNKTETLVEQIILVVTGIWFLKMSLHCVLLLSDRVPMYALAVCALFSISGFIVYAIS